MLAFGIDWLVYAAIAAALLASAALILSVKKPEVAFSQDDRVSNYATRGSYIPLLIGRDILGAIHIWNDPAEPTLVGADYRDNGLHVICVGPASKLNAIYVNSKKVWEGPITPSSHPSGTEIATGALGNFRVYWGYQDDPVVDLIAAASNHGVGTRYPLTFKILWEPIILGPTKNWPRVEYDVERACVQQLASSPSTNAESYVDSGSPTWREIIEKDEVPSIYLPAGQLMDDRPRFGVIIVEGGPEYHPTSRKIAILDLNNHNLAGAGSVPDYSLLVGSGDVIKVSGSQPIGTAGISLALLFPGGVFDASREYLHVLDSAFVNDFFYETVSGSGQFFQNTTLPPGVFNPYRGATILTIGPRSNWPIFDQIAETTATPPRVWMTRRIASASVNPIHAIAQILFAPWPDGGGRNKDRYDMQSIEEAAAWFSSRELFRCSVTASDGETGDQVIARIMQDIGMWMPFNPITGLYCFKIIRHPGTFGDDAVPDLPQSVILERPEIVNTRGPQPVDKVMFTFRDESINFRDQPLAIDDDGNATVRRVQGAKTIPITTTTSILTAREVAKRRTQEVGSNLSGYRLIGNHSTRKMFAGQSFTTAALGDNTPQRLTAIKRSTSTSRNEIDSLVDCYDPPVPVGLVGGGMVDFGGDQIISSLTFDDLPDGGKPAKKAARLTLDIAARAFEVPRFMSGLQIQMLFLRLRSTKQSYGFRIWVSRDNSTYTMLGSMTGTFSGGLLTEDMPAYPMVQDDDSVVIETLGDASSDADLASRLDAAREDFLAGKQMALIEDELVFISALNQVGDRLWTISQGMIRGRLGTKAVSHPAGSPVFVFQADNLPIFNSVLFAPNKTLWVKIQPTGSSPPVSLASIQPLQLTLTGKALKPCQPIGLRISGFRARHTAAEDVPIRWNHFASGRSGLGMQGFGEPIGMNMEGHFLVQFALASNPDTIIRQATVTTPEFIYTQDMRVEDGSDLEDWIVKVKHIERGYASSAIEASFGSD